MSLKDVIIKASQEYYSTGTSSLSDAEFDKLVDQLKQSPDSSLADEVGTGYDVNKDSTPGKRVWHRYGTAGSLDKVHNWKEYAMFKNMNSDVVASTKVDGLSVLIYYTEGKLTQALTRGDGNTGIDITPKMLKIDEELSSIITNVTCCVRGEIVMSYKNFESFKEIHPEAKNPRNSAVGLINSIEISEDLGFLDVIVYNVVGLSGDFCLDLLKNYTDTNEWLKHSFNHVVPISKVSLASDNIDETMKQLRDDWYGDYPYDGIVLSNNHTEPIKVSDDDWSIKFDAVAYKFPAETKETTVRDINWSLTKTKYLVPVVEFDEIELSGTNVRFATGFNAQYIEKYGICPGTQIKVMKSGEIIPKIEYVFHDGEWLSTNADTSAQFNANLPTICPSCGSNLVREGVHLCCPNIDCSDSKIQDVLVWTENISPTKGLGQSLKLKFLEIVLGESNISIESIYKKGKIVPFSTQSQAKLFTEMYNSLFEGEVDAQTAIRALNVPRIGDIVSSKVAKFPKDIENLMNGSTNLSAEFVQSVGQANSESIIANVDKFARLSFIYDRISYPGEKAIKGKIVITGKLSMKRADLESIAKDSGYDIGSSVSKDTTYLVTNDTESGSSKNRKAKELGTTILTEEQFLKLCDR